MVTNYLNAKNGIEIWHDDGITQILSGSSDPSVAGKEATIGSVYLCTSDTIGLFLKTGPEDTSWSSIFVGFPVDSFLGLLDTPSTYTNYNGYFVHVDTTTSGLTFGDSLDCGTFL